MILPTDNLLHNTISISPTDSADITNTIHADEIEIYNGLIEFEYQKINNQISLTGAAVAASNGKRSTAIRQIEIECDCKGKRNTRRCSCFAAKQKCNSHCHAKTSHLKCCENVE